MTLGSVLFSPNGRIGARTFWRGLIVLLMAVIILQVASVYAGQLVGGIAGVISLGLVYPYLCVFGKRLHDAGKSAWWFLLFLFGYVVLSGVLQMVLLPVLSPAAAELNEEMSMLMENGQWADAFAYGPEIARESLFTSLISLIACNAVLGFLAARLKSDPSPNQYGPPEGSSVSTPFD